LDETFLGGVKPGKRGRGAAGKAMVVVAVEQRAKRSKPLPPGGHPARAPPLTPRGPAPPMAVTQPVVVTALR
jgi:hypothetical protein